MSLCWHHEDFLSTVWVNLLHFFSWEGTLDSENALSFECQEKDERKKTMNRNPACPECAFFGGFPTDTTFRDWHTTELDQLRRQHIQRQGRYQEVCTNVTVPRQSPQSAAVTPVQREIQGLKARMLKEQQGLQNTLREIKDATTKVEAAGLELQKAKDALNALEKNRNNGEAGIRQLKQQIEGEQQKASSSTMQPILAGINQEYCAFLASLLEAEKAYLEKAPKGPQRTKTKKVKFTHPVKLTETGFTQQETK